jgi:hypothetical protein
VVTVSGTTVVVPLVGDCDPLVPVDVAVPSSLVADELSSDEFEFESGSVDESLFDVLEEPDPEFVVAVWLPDVSGVPSKTATRLAKPPKLAAAATALLRRSVRSRSTRGPAAPPVASGAGETGWPLLVMSSPPRLS